MSEISVDLSFERIFSGELKARRGQAHIGKGGESSFRPYDLMLGALGACFYATFVDIADKMRLEYESADISVHGVKREEVPTTLKTVDMVFTIRGAKSAKGFERAAELAAKYCSVHETISKVAEITLKTVVEEAEA